MGEMTITPEDVYHLLRLLTRGELVYYDTIYDGSTCRRVFGDPSIGDQHIQWAQFILFPVLPVVLGTLIGGFLLPDRHGHGFFVGWGPIIEDLMADPRHFD